MTRTITELLKKPGVRYLLTGGSVYLLELLVIVVAEHYGSSPVVAVGLSFWIGLVVSFIIQKVFTFGDKRVNHKILLPQVICFSLLVLWNFGFTVLVTDLLKDTLPPVVTRTLALGVTTVWNFYLYKTRIFKQDPPEEVVY